MALKLQLLLSSTMHYISILILVLSIVSGTLGYAQEQKGGPVDPELEALVQCSLSTKKEELLKTLDVKHGARIIEDGALFDRFFLAYLSQTFEALNVKGPLFLHATDTEGPQLVQKKIETDGVHLYFTKNAAQHTLAAAVRKFAQAVKQNPGLEFNSKAMIQYDYNNTLLEQLTEALTQAEDLKAFMEKKFELRFEALEHNANSKIASSFSQKELSVIAKQLSDLPTNIRKNLALRNIVRLQRGIKTIPGTAYPAVYRLSEKTIYLADNAFNQDSTFGEGSVLHELGHAHWYALPEATRTKYVDLSWKKNEKGLSPKDINLFITDYSRENIDEDFAEHFEAYVHNSELIGSKVPIKFNFLNSEIFDNTIYYSMVHRNAKASVELTDCKDTSPPQFELPILESIKLSCKAIDSDKLEVIADIHGVKDDVSGIKYIGLHLVPKKPQSAILMPRGDLDSISLYLYPKERKEIQDVIDAIEKGKVTIIPDPREQINLAKDGEPSHLRIRSEIRASEYPEDEYFVHAVSLSDKADNRLWLTSNEKGSDLRKLSVKIPGTNKRRVRKPVIIDPKLVKFEPTGLRNGKQTFKVQLPVEHEAGLKRIYLQFKALNFEYDVDFDFFDNSYGDGSSSETLLDRKFISKRGDKTIQFGIEFPESFSSDDLMLINTNIEFGATPQASATAATMNVVFKTQKENFPNLVLHLQNNAPDTTHPDVDVNQVKVEVEKSETPNSEGGKAKIKVRVPVTGIEKNRVKATVILRTPEGKTIRQEFRTHKNRDYQYADWSKPITVEEKDGKKEAVLPVELKPNAESGEYKVESITVEEDLVTPHPLDEEMDKIRSQATEKNKQGDWNEANRLENRWQELYRQRQNEKILRPNEPSYKKEIKLLDRGIKKGATLLDN